MQEVFHRKKSLELEFITYETLPYKVFIVEKNPKQLKLPPNRLVNFSKFLQKP
jgi:hypothetical protein